MSESTVPSPSNPPRWSKTAAIVMLVVFSLVFVVALFGLWAFMERREADVERSRARVMDDAAHMLEDVSEVVRVSLSDALRAAGAVRHANDLRTHAAEAGLVRQACRYDEAKDTYLWIDGTTPLFIGEARRAGSIADAQEDVAAATEASEMLEAPSQSLSLPADARVSLVHAWVELVSAYPLVARPAKGGGRAYPLALYYAQNVLKAAEHVPDTAEGQRAMRRALLAALSTESLNRERSDVDRTLRERMRARIHTLATALRKRLPADGLIRWEIDRFIALRDLLVDATHRRPIENALSAARVNLDSVNSRRVPGQVGQVQLHPHWVAVVVSSDAAPMLTALELDPAALRTFIDRELARPRWHKNGVRPVLTRPSDDTWGPTRLQSLAHVGRRWNLPLVVAAKVDASSTTTTPTDWFYWGIIVLACLGIAVGGWVLVRVLTRQVRLAELKSDFVSNMSHELKTPITSIGLFAEMLQDGKIDEPEERAEAYEVIVQETERLKQTVARMLDIARRAASRASPYDMQPGDLNVPVRRAVERFERLTTGPGLTLSVQIKAEPLPIVLDEAAIEDVVANLLGNAWKYRRGDAAHIRVRTLRRRGKAVLEVADDGTGISRSERKRVFQMFYRSEQYLNQPVPGTGLGLALARTVVRGHRGRIRVIDGLGGRGSAFVAAFPLHGRVSGNDQEVTDEKGTTPALGDTSPSRAVAPEPAAGRRPVSTTEKRRTSGPAAEHS